MVSEGNEWQAFLADYEGTSTLAENAQGDELTKAEQWTTSLNQSTASETLFATASGIVDG